MRSSRDSSKILRRTLLVSPKFERGLTSLFSWAYWYNFATAWNEGGVLSEGLVVCRSRPIIVGNPFQRLITKPEKLTPRVVKTTERWKYEEMSKKNPHADMMPHVEFKFNISVQVIVHNLIYGIVLILCLLMSAWPSWSRRWNGGASAPLHVF